MTTLHCKCSTTNLLQVLLSMILCLNFIPFQQESAIVSAACHEDSWCVEPFCECRSMSWFPWYQWDACLDGFSGTNCRCQYAPTNIARRPFWQFFPDSLQGSLDVAEANNGESILAGTWTSGYEWSLSSMDFQNLRSSNDETENVWSITKTSIGSYLLGTPVGIQRKSADQQSFQEVLSNVGSQGHFAEVDGKIFAGTFQGLYMSMDDGNTWTRTPSTCPETDSVNDPDGGGTGPHPKPSTLRWCEEQVTDVIVFQGKVIAFFNGYAGPHYTDPVFFDPELLSSWTALPTLQDQEEGPCWGGFCHVHEAIVFQNALYLAFMSKTVYRLPLVPSSSSNGVLSTADAWETIFISDSVDNQGATALTTVPDEDSIYVSTVDGLYRSSTGDSNTWELMDNEACSRQNTHPLLSRGLVSTPDGSRLIIGTLYGPWVYRIW